MKDVIQLMRRISFCLAFVIFFKTLDAQNYAAQRSQVFFVNVISNALMGGIGGAINKNKGEKTYKAFARNFLKGGLGGLVKYSAKYQTFYLALQPNSVYVPINRLYFFLGHSFVMNAAYNKKILDTYFCNFWGLDLRVSMKEEQKIKARLSFATAVSAAYMGAQGFQLDLYKSLEYGQLMFSMKEGQLGIYSGMSLFNSIVLTRNSGLNYDMSVFPHEMVHGYQAYDYFAISSFYDKKLRSKYKDNKYYSFLSRFMVLDYEVLFFSSMYLPQFRPMPNYYKNYFEFEAEHCKSRMAVIR